MWGFTGGQSACEYVLPSTEQAGEGEECWQFQEATLPVPELKLTSNTPKAMIFWKTQWPRILTVSFLNHVSSLYLPMTQAENE